MKTKLHLFNIRPLLWIATIVGFALPITLRAATNGPTAEVIQSGSSLIAGVQVYTIRFPGGSVSAFFRFMRTNGFANDSVLFAGNADRVYIPEFTVSNVKLKEIAKSIEFVAESKISVELIESPQAGDVNVWRIRPADSTASDQLKTRACALPTLFAGPKPEERIRKIADRVEQTLINVALHMNQSNAQIPRGSFTLLDTEKIVVVVGTEAYVEAITSALEAAEKVAEIEAVEKSKPR